jgi:hypothetical protein
MQHIAKEPDHIRKKNTEMILLHYAKMHRQGNASRDNRGARPPSDIQNVVYCKVQGVRDFCRYYGMNWPRGTSGIMSQKDQTMENTATSG